MSTSTDLIIFGGTGDLAQRKLLPALCRLQLAGQLGSIRSIRALGRSALSTNDYRSLVETALKDSLGTVASHDQLPEFYAKLQFLALDATRPADFTELYRALSENGRADQTVCYLATVPDLYGIICENLKTSGITDAPTRVVLEKPIGNDLPSYQRINRQVLTVFDEDNVFRIDHYLGKEAVQNLLALRFGNALFDPVWNSQHIDNIQITVAEAIGVAGRGDFYARTGALRDMVQNHILQVLCLVAMEPPASLEADTIRDEKLKVLRGLNAITAANVRDCLVRGQYAAGEQENETVPGFLEEAGFAESTDTETFVALRAGIHNWRWTKVPIYLRTGKRLARRYSEIVVEFRKHPFSLFADDQNHLPNKLVINLQPEESITLHTVQKKPGLTRGIKLEPVSLKLSAEPGSKQRSEAYERLLLDVFTGDQTLFMRGDEVEAAWRWIDGVIAAWEEVGLTVEPYPAGSMGPATAQSLPEREGRHWHE